MPSRMDRYNKEDLEVTRTIRNEQLYKDIYNNRMYTEFTGTNKSNVIDMSQIDEAANRRVDIYRNGISYKQNNNVRETRNRSKKNLYDDLDIYSKNYDVNDILKEAKENRQPTDDDKIRKIKNTEYSILSDLSHEKLNEYHNRKENPLSEKDKEELEELVNTITSKTLRAKIDDTLFKDLMPDDENEEVISKEVLDNEDLKKIKDKNANNDYKEEKEETTLIDKSFYTRSMDLKKEDLIGKEDADNELDDSFVDKNKAKNKKIIIIMLTIIFMILFACLILFVL